MVRLASFFVTISAVLLTLQANADPIQEIGGAGQSITTAQDVTGHDITHGIQGTIGNFADMFQFSWAGGGITIDTEGTVGVDTQLFLFDSLGNGIWGNDDGGTGLLSMITDAALAAGNYFIGISRYNYDPRYANGDLIFDSSPFTVQHGPNPGVGGLDHWAGGCGPGCFQGSSYAINFTAAAVPEPGTLALFALGLLGLSLGQRKAVK